MRKRTAGNGVDNDGWRRRTVWPAFLLAAVLAFGAPAPLTATAGERPPIEIVGLFKNRAVVRDGGQERLMRVGESTRAGVELVSANAAEAVVKYKGRRYTLNLSRRVASTFQEVEQTRVTVPADALGQYRVNGTINGEYVQFLVDTGASIVALSSQTADRIGLDYRSAKTGLVETAQGRAKSWFLKLSVVDVGGLVARNVEAAVVSGAYPSDILLGMSYLSDVSVQEANGVLSMTREY